MFWERTYCACVVVLWERTAHVTYRCTCLAIELVKGFKLIFRFYGSLLLPHLFDFLVLGFVILHRGFLDVLCHFYGCLSHRNDIGGGNDPRNSLIMDIRLSKREFAKFGCNQPSY